MREDDSIRLVKCEQTLISISKQVDEHIESNDERIQRLQNSVSAIEALLKNQQGFIRGVVFTVTAIASGIGLIAGYFHKG